MVQNYDKLDGFIKYTSKEGWKTYIEKCIIPFWKKAWLINEFFEFLKQEFHDLSYDECKEEYKQLFLGGIKARDDDFYTNNSLAKFYTEFFGLKLKDFQSLIIQKKYNENLTEIKSEVKETQFIKFVKEIHNILDYALRYQSLITDYSSPTINYEHLKKDPDILKEIIKDFFQNVLNLVLNYNYGTFFLSSLNHVPYYYIKLAYPKIDQILDFLQTEFGLIEFSWRNPINPETETYKNYTIYSFPELNLKKKGKSFGGAIELMNEKIWEYFEDTSFREKLSFLFRDIRNLKEDYIEKIRNILPEANFFYHIYYNGISASENNYNLGTSKYTIMDMIDANASYLFTNVLKISYFYEDSSNNLGNFDYDLR